MYGCLPTCFARCASATVKIYFSVTMSTNLATEVKTIITSGLLDQIYSLKFPWSRERLPSGSYVGNYHFKPTEKYIEEFRRISFEPAIVPLSKFALEDLLDLDLPSLLLPKADAPNYPEQALGLILLIDQARIYLGKGYAVRYMRAFFDPIGEKIARQLVLDPARPATLRPDSEQAWLSRGYSFDDWLARTLWFWAPLVHADKFMVDDRATLKNWLHEMRAKVEEHCGYADPFAPLEAADDVDITLFQAIETDGPTKRTYDRSASKEKEGTMSDYAFWWIRILNAHFAITDMCGHYPYWIRATGRQWTDNDKEFMKKTGGQRYTVTDEPVLEDIRKDFLAGVWKPLSLLS